MLDGYTGKILDINLSNSKIAIQDLSERDARMFIGGKGIATKILFTELKKGSDPLSPSNILIFGTGPLTGSNAPNSNRFTITTKSPLTNGITSSACGGNFAAKLKKSGFDFLIVRGKAKKPVYIEINNEKAEIKDATNLWGKGTIQTQSLLPPKSGKAVIGPAGENQVRYACVVSEERVAGRTGCGAVMGSKNLKAITADGDVKARIADEEEFKNFRKKITQYFLKHQITGTILPRLGTANLVLTTSGRNILPTYNFQKGSHRNAFKISGEELAEKHMLKNGGCFSCPVRCGRVVKYQEHEIKGPEFETTAHFGTNIGNFNLTNTIEWNYLCDDLGIDTISGGNTIAFAMELTKRGLFKSNLKFEKTDNISELIRDISYRRGIGADLAEGVKRMSEKYGGKEFAMHVKGLELPAYDPRGCYGQGLEYATTNRGGCHIQGATMFLEATGPLTINPHTTKSKPELVIMQQNLFCSISSLIMCAFAAYAMVPPFVINISPHSFVYKMITKIVENSGLLLGLTLNKQPDFAVTYFEKFLSQITGEKHTMRSLALAGERIFNLERLFNLREGFTNEDDILPDRILNESTFDGIKGGVPLDQMLPRYYKLRGWSSNGIPTEKTLERLGLSEYAV